MRQIMMAAACAGALMAGATGAEARGCITGAIIGGLAGHAMHHGLAGAAAGCAAGSGAAHYYRAHNNRSALQRDQKTITPPITQ